MPDFTRLATAIVLVIVVIIGGVVVIVQPATLAFDQYIRDVGLAAGLLGIGYGIDAHSKP